MNNLLQFLYKHIHWIVFIVLEIICFVLLFSYNSFQGSVYLSTAGDLTARWLRGKDRVTTYFGLADKNRALSEQNARLQQRVVELEMLNAQFRLDSLAEAEAVSRVYRAGYRIRPAQVIDKSVNRMSNFITLDRGTADGIGPDIGPQYRSQIFYLDDVQLHTAQQVIALLRSKGHEVNTTLRPAQHFWPGEEYHQDYYNKTGEAPYCHIRVKKF